MIPCLRRSLFLVAFTSACATHPAAPPVAPRHPRIFELHGDRRIDDYDWLRRKDSPEVLAYLAAENAYTSTVMRPTEPLQKALYAEMLARIQETDLSVPYRKRGYYYYSRTEKGRQYPILCRKRGSLDAPEEIMLDLNALARGERFLAVGQVAVSPDDAQLAYTIDTTGFRVYTLFVRDLRTGELHPDRANGVDQVAWAKDSKTLFYVTEDAAKRPYLLHRHVLGTDSKVDPIVYEEKDALFTLGVGRTRSDAYLVVTSQSHTASELRVLAADDPTGTFRVIAPRTKDHEYDLDHRGDLFYIRTNDRGRNFRLVTVTVDDPRRERWRELVPHRDDVMLEDVELFRDHYVLYERQGALPRLRVVPFTRGAPRDIPSDEPLYELAPERNAEFDTTIFRYSYESLVTPPSIYDYDLRTGERILRKREPVLGGYDPGRYAQERVWAQVGGGLSIPISLVYRKGVARDGRAPMLLYGYGAYGIPIGAEFDSGRVSLLDRGVIFAIAHVRGGGDLGKPWHDQGRMMKKQNTFNDFIACAEHLVRAGYTSADRLAIEGGSAGGLLIGAVVNQRPDLFRVAVAEVPFVDVLSTMLDESLPLTTGEFEEWGNPRQPGEYRYMRSYSPYDNVAAKPYPTMLVKSSYNDSQVMYFEPAKWVAKLRATKTDRNPLLLRMEMDPAGHGGKSGRYERIAERAFVVAFVLWNLGIRQ
jgi:oligopeptidase B